MHSVATRAKPDRHKKFYYQIFSRTRAIPTPSKRAEFVTTACFKQRRQKRAAPDPFALLSRENLKPRHVIREWKAEGFANDRWIATYQSVRADEDALRRMRWNMLCRRWETHVLKDRIINWRSFALFKQ